MRPTIVLAALALAGCQTHSPQAVPAPAAPSVAGMTFEIRDEPGVDRTHFAHDGTYTDYFRGAKVGQGRYEQRPDGQLCFHSAQGGEPACWVIVGRPDAQGWATSVRVSDGLRVQVRPAQAD